MDSLQGDVAARSKTFRKKASAAAGRAALSGSGSERRITQAGEYYTHVNYNGRVLVQRFMQLPAGSHARSGPPSPKGSRTAPARAGPEHRGMQWHSLEGTSGERQSWSRCKGPCMGSD